MSRAAAYRHGFGYSLIEMLVGLGLMAFLLLMTVPNVTAYLTDSRIRAAAQAYYGAAQWARAEAVRRNASVQLVLTNEPGVSPPVASVDGVGWAVLVGDELISSRAPAETAASAVQVVADKAEVDFDNMGAANLSQLVKFSSATTDDCYPEGPRCLHIVISRGGQVRLCDPAITSDADNRKC